jgi:glutaconyl-CoA/methylmalonyl-CoA decarboxylase subunit gamma
MKKLRVTVEGKSYEVTVEVLEDGKSPVKSSGETKVASPSVAAAPATPVKPNVQSIGKGDLVSPMSGSILAINVKVGDKVVAGQILVVLEAMKMETPIAAPQAGKVASIQVAVGKTVEEGQLLLKLES